MTRKIFGQQQEALRIEVNAAGLMFRREHCLSELG